MTAGILLAAGAASRFGTQKLLAPLHGRPLVLHALSALQPAVDSLIAVVGPDSDELAALLRQAGACVVVCDEAALGMGHSLACGARHAPTDANLLIALGDMPAVTTASIRLIGAALADGAGIAVPVHAGRRGHPVGFAARFAPLLCGLTKDQGARTVLLAHADTVQEIAVDDPGVLADVDTPLDLQRLAEHSKSGP
jgi:molybdenum cofactor cytidylyltransferase